MLPDEEIDALTTAVDAAVALAAETKFASGYDLLTIGLRNAWRARHAGHPWAREMVRRYRSARENYIEAYGVKLEEAD